MAKKTEYEKLVLAVSRDLELSQANAKRFLTNQLKNPEGGQFENLNERLQKRVLNYTNKTLEQIPVVPEKKEKEARPRVSKNPLYGETLGGYIEVDANFGYYGGDRKIRLRITDAEMTEIGKAETLRDAVMAWANSKDGQFLDRAEEEISNIRSIKRLK